MTYTNKLLERLRLLYSKNTVMPGTTEVFSWLMYERLKRCIRMEYLNERKR